MGLAKAFSITSNWTGLNSTKEVVKESRFAKEVISSGQTEVRLQLLRLRWDSLRLLLDVDRP